MRFNAPATPAFRQSVDLTALMDYPAAAPWSAHTKAATRRPCRWRSARVNRDIAIQSAGNSGIQQSVYLTANMFSLQPRWHMSAVSRKLRPWPARRAQIGAHIRMLLRHALRLDTSPPETNEHSGISPQSAHKGAKPEHHPRPRKSSSTALRQARPTTPHCLTLDTALATASKLAAVP